MAVLPLSLILLYEFTTFQLCQILSCDIELFIFRKTIKVFLMCDRDSVISHLFQAFKSGIRKGSQR